MKLLPALLLSATLCCASESVMPRCNAKNRGQFWPEEANRSGAAAQRAARCGELRMCTIGLWKYQWQPLGVSVPRPASNSAAAGCRAADEPARETTASTAVED